MRSWYSLRSLFILLAGCLLFSLASAQTQTHTSPDKAVVINSFPSYHKLLNSSSGASASGMGGTCYTLPCCSIWVYRVDIPTAGSIRIENRNFTPLAGSIIAYKANKKNPTKFSDLTYLSQTGNFCGFRDTMQLGWAYKWTHGNRTAAQNAKRTPGWTAFRNPPNSSVPDTVGPGSYYVLVWSKNNQANLGTDTATFVFRFKPYCGGTTGRTCPPIVDINSNDNSIGQGSTVSILNNTLLDSVSIYDSRTITYSLENASDSFFKTKGSSPVSISGPGAAYFSIAAQPADDSLSTGDSTSFQIKYSPVNIGSDTVTIKIANTESNNDTFSFIIIGNALDLRPIAFAQKFEGTTDDNWTYSPNPAKYATETDSVIAGSEDIWDIIREFTGDIDGPFDGRYFWGTQDLRNSNGGRSFAHHLNFENVYVGNLSDAKVKFNYYSDGFDSSDSLYYEVFHDDVRQGKVFLEKNSDAWLTVRFDIPNTVDSFRFTWSPYNDGSSDYSGFDGLEIRGTTGPVMAPEIAVLGNGIEISSGTSATSSTNNTDYGLVSTTSSAVSKTFYIKNTGSARLNLGGSPKVSLSGTHASDFSVTTQPADTVGVGDSSAFVIRFLPSASGTRYATVSITNDDADENPYTFNLSGGIPGPSGLDEDFSSTIIPTGWTQTTVSPNDSWRFGGGLDFGSTATIPDPDNNLGEYARMDFSTDPDTTSLITPEVTLNLAADTVFSFYYITQTTSTAFTPYNRLIVDYWNGAKWINITVIDTLTTVGWAKYQYTPANYVYNNNKVKFRFAAQEGGAAIGGTGTTTFDQDMAIDNVYVGSGVIATGPSVSTVADSMVSCKGGSDGGATATASGGTAPYTYSWSNGDTTASADSLLAGKYYITVKDANNDSIVDSIIITEPFELVATANVDSNASCFGTSDGGTTVSAIGGTAPYTYLWANNLTQASITGIKKGRYAVTVTDKNGCTDTTSSVITEPIVLTTILAVDSHAVKGPNSGGATVQVSGGTSPYTYLWSNNATTANAIGLDPGVYRVTVTDKNGCTKLDSVEIYSRAVVTLNTSSNVSCIGLSDGRASASVSGGTAPYKYLWSTGDTTLSTDSLKAGSYVFRVIDALLDTISDTIVITQPDTFKVSISSFANLLCNNDSSGTILATSGFGSGTSGSIESFDSTSSLSAGWSSYNDISSSSSNAFWKTRGSPGYSMNGTKDHTGNSGSFAWVDGSTPYPAKVSLESPNIANVSDLTFWMKRNTSGQNLTKHNDFIMDVYDGTAWNNDVFTHDTMTENGDWQKFSVDISPYLKSDSFKVRFTVSKVGQPFSFYDDIALDDIGSGSSVNYNWTLGTDTVSTVALLDNAKAGTYKVIATSSEGCSDTITQTISEPLVLGSSIQIKQNVSCFNKNDGEAFVVLKGGTMPYTYNWNNASTNDTISALAADTFSLIATDANGCVVNDTTIITQPDSLIAIAMVDTNVRCNGAATGAASLKTIGGTMPYTYAWTNSATTDSLKALAAGNYKVAVTDANGCLDSSEITIIEPAALVAGTIDGDT
ncbi:MAG: choice-of-anchor D domain-containing protein, partial [Bacteroidia bacterium]